MPVNEFMDSLYQKSPKQTKSNTIDAFLLLQLTLKYTKRDTNILIAFIYSVYQNKYILQKDMQRLQLEVLSKKTYLFSIISFTF